MAIKGNVEQDSDQSKVSRITNISRTAYTSRISKFANVPRMANMLSLNKKT